MRDTEDLNPIINHEIEINTTSEVEIPESGKSQIRHWISQSNEEEK